MSATTVCKDCGHDHDEAAAAARQVRSALRRALDLATAPRSSPDGDILTAADMYQFLISRGRGYVAGKEGFENACARSFVAGAVWQRMRGETS